MLTREKIDDNIDKLFQNRAEAKEEKQQNKIKKLLTILNKDVNI